MSNKKQPVHYYDVDEFVTERNFSVLYDWPPPIESKASVIIDNRQFLCEITSHEIVDLGDIAIMEYKSIHREQAVTTINLLTHKPVFKDPYPEGYLAFFDKTGYQLTDNIGRANHVFRYVSTLMQCNTQLPYQSCMASLLLGTPYSEPQGEILDHLPYSEKHRSCIEVNNPSCLNDDSRFDRVRNGNRIKTNKALAYSEITGDLFLVRAEPMMFI